MSQGLRAVMPTTSCTFTLVCRDSSSISERQPSGGDAAVSSGWGFGGPPSPPVAVPSICSRPLAAPRRNSVVLRRRRRFVRLPRRRLRRRGCQGDFARSFGRGLRRRGRATGRRTGNPARLEARSGWVAGHGEMLWGGYRYIDNLGLSQGDRQPPGEERPETVTRTRAVGHCLIYHSFFLRRRRQRS
jgi:hypothetical protein